MVTDAEQRDVLEKVYWFMTSKSKTIERLSKSRGYSADSAARILDSLQIDWKKIALVRTEEYLIWDEADEQPAPTKEAMFEFLCKDLGFSEYEARWAVEQISESRWGTEDW